ncbi:TIGR03668 family PPOX class F420-dependent oxidoreductase [Rubrobacter xylanophilus]|uniref:TIGR03668 family PPOX class F420-dependent oxidoreductase n=1 Tax=Rubrobacter xylanophilus TaxID=49319 RepID=UPI000323F6B3|nr:TIGR03668 family PPOX class F420-dependent oxidoreductase [Rubrobacter xylanophilus]
MSPPQAVLSPEEAAFLAGRRVARLATSSSRGEPHVVPVCFACGSGGLYVPLDDKPKRVPPRRLRRVRNILENPRAALLADRYAEDWGRLAFVMVRGRAELLEPGGEEHGAAVRLLRGKYHQYERRPIERSPVIVLRPERAASWGALGETDRDEGRLLDVLLGRRSVRRYLPKEVPEEAVERVLEAARWAPSPHGAQPWRFAVIRRRGTRERLAGAMGEEWRRNLEMDGQPPGVVGRRLEGSRRRLMDAPVLILACLYLGDLDPYPDEGRRRSEETMAVQSLGAAVQNMLLAAYELGLDTGWMCAPLFCPERVVEALGLDPGLIPHALVTLGYAEGDPPRRRGRRPLEELVVYRE